MSKLRDTVRVSIQCPECPEMTEKPLPWLVDMNSLYCPTCQHEIGLQDGELHAFLQRLDRACTESEPTEKIV